MPKINYKKLDYIFKNSDIITFHIPLDKDTFGLFDKRKLNKIRVNSVIINTSRGEIFNENDLISVMNKKNIKYYTDVLANESNSNSIKFDKFKKTNQFFYSFHKGGMTEESVLKTDKFIIKKDFKNSMKSLK